MNTLGSPDHSLYDLYFHYTQALVQASKLDDALHVFEEMEVNHVGRRCQEFYLEYSRLMCADDARRTLRKGIACCANNEVLHEELAKRDHSQVDAMTEVSMEVEITGQSGYPFLELGARHVYPYMTIFTDLLNISRGRRDVLKFWKISAYFPDICKIS